MWATNLKVIAVTLLTVGFYTLVARSIPQIESEVPEELSFGADVSAEQLVTAGERVYNGAGGCTACHGLGTRAPNLLSDHAGEGAIGARCGGRVPGEDCKAYLYASMTNPGAYVVAGFENIMPDVRRQLPADQIWAAIAFLQSQGGEVTVSGADLPAAGAGADAAPPAAGPARSATSDPHQLLTENACLGCHAIDGAGPPIGPSFDGMGGRISADRIRRGILDPDAEVAAGFDQFAGMMPKTFGDQLSAAQLEILVQFLCGEALMGRLRGYLGHPFWQAVGLMVLAYLVFKWGIAVLPPLVGVASAPVPQSVVLQYMLTAFVGVLLYVSDNEERWSQFKQPIHAALTDGDKRWVRGTLLVLVPALVGFVTFDQVRPKVSAPIQLRSIHPAPPGEIRFRGQTIQLAGLENPLRGRGSMEQHYATGRRVYYQNCLPCHGDLLDGEGHFGHGFSPTPLPFDDPGTIAQLTESFVFWRIAKGGPGLPREGTPWNSAMPVWEDFLTEDEIWAVIVFLYEQSGFEPRRWEAASEGEGGGH